MTGRLSEILLLLAAGAAFGPHGVGVLSSETLSYLDPAMPVALVALGVLVGISIGAHRPRNRRLAAAVAAEGAVTMTAVASGVLVATQWWPAAVEVPQWFVAIVLGICAVPSAGALLQPGGEPHSAVERLGDLGALLPIGMSGIALALLQEASPGGALVLVVQSCGVALLIAAAAWLLVGTSTSETEQRVFTVALLLLLGGAADYLGLSALLSGLVAGLFLDLAGGAARDSVHRDVLHVRRPLVVLVLIVTGARLNLPPAWVGLGVSYLLFRTLAKLAGAWTARRVAGDAAPDDLGRALLSPGIIGIAFALNALRAAGPDLAPLLTVVTAGAVASGAIAAAAPREAGE
jgi:hypothetical protein